MTKRIATLLLAGMAAIGCGSGGGGTTGTGGNGAGGAGGSGACAANGPGSTPGASMSWSDDGAFECADFVRTTRSTKNGFDTLAGTGTLTTNIGLSFTINVANAMIENKAYDCDGTYIVLVYEKGTAADTTQSCTITLTSVGAAGVASTGTFSAVVTAAGSGATENITNGTFTAVPVIN